MLCSPGICIGWSVHTVIGGCCAHSTMVIIRDGLIRRPIVFDSQLFLLGRRAPFLIHQQIPIRAGQGRAELDLGPSDDDSALLPHLNLGNRCQRRSATKIPNNLPSPLWPTVELSPFCSMESTATSNQVLHLEQSQSKKRRLRHAGSRSCTRGSQPQLNSKARPVESISPLYEL
jgi:hypothetical protein